MARGKKADIPRVLADVEPWCRRLQAQCLNEDARQLVGSAAAEYLAMFAAIDRHYEALASLEAAVGALESASEEQREVAQIRVKVAAIRLRSCPGEVEVRAKMVPLIVALVGNAQAANRGEADAAIVKLRQFAAQRERLVADFGPAHKAAKKPKKEAP